MGIVWNHAKIPQEATMKKILVMGSLLSLFFTPNIVATSAKPIIFEKVFANCAALNKTHPGGVAMSASAAKSATLSGYLTPTVSKSAYEASKKYGDNFSTGFSCPKFGKSNLGTTKLQADWGYITARETKRPMNGICVFVPLVIDVRNASKINQTYGITIALQDDFENVIGYQEWSGATNNSSEARNGKFNTSLKVCKARHKWKHFSGNRDQSVEPIGSENWYWLNSYSWLGTEFQGASDFEFRK
jgi:hypothetical protein